MSVDEDRQCCNLIANIILFGSGPQQQHWIEKRVVMQFDEEDGMGYCGAGTDLPFLHHSMGLNNK